MGNDQSQFSGIDVKEKAVEITDFWSHHSANINFGNFNKLSVFIGEPIVDGSLWLKQTPLEKSCKHLMIYRHPCILKYVSSWQKGSKFHVAVEDVRPLSHVLLSQSSLQLCIGLHSILKALCFLHERAAVSHNNICIASIYVTRDGSWKLGGMEYLCKFNELTHDYLNKIKTFRYHKAIDSNEQKTLLGNCDRYDFIDLYAYSILVCEVFKNKSDDIPALSPFLDLCKNDLQNVDIHARPKLSTLLQHPFFNHDFIQIHCFLTELPLKSDSDKNEFFSTLIEKLKCFDEATVAKQLSGLLLSRMVLLNKTAQLTVIPFVLYPKEDAVSSNGLFSQNIFKKYLIPKLLDIFCVRDAQIRQLLLNHFIHYMNCFTYEELQSQILPELLVGIKDTNDHLVAITLRALADLVPILGAATVIGGKRAKLFNDGRPIIHSTKRHRRPSRRNHEIDASINATPSSSNITEISEPSAILDLPERPSPDGEEGETSTEGGEIEAEEDIDNWEDWDINDDTRDISNNPGMSLSEVVSSSVDNNSGEDEETDHLQNVETAANDLNITSKNPLPNILELDIKNQKNAIKMEDFDFFQDMEPVIQSSNYVVEGLNEKRKKSESDKKFSVVDSEHHEDGWGDDLDWD
ncbi:scy1-related s/t protein kinase-like [Holotrichia oblita]|uniref:Scy1-related s/t protein kinase-like n=1 Tax=Holotrichia oblita TaxID=644536 RepID=A0ACB9SY56_HOLOL|nr:scy1-related s/t protein kinase-like [Holotrichia oblita]